MYILGDIGNSDTKIFLVNEKNRILKRINLITKNINIKLDNKTCEQTVALHKTHKWDKLRTLEQKGLIELRTGAGRSPEAKIIIPTMH